MLPIYKSGEDVFHLSCILFSHMHLAMLNDSRQREPQVSGMKGHSSYQLLDLEDVASCKCTAVVIGSAQDGSEICLKNNNFFSVTSTRVG